MSYTETMKALLRTCFQHGSKSVGVLTKQMAEYEMQCKRGRITTIQHRDGDRQVYFFSDNHIFGFGVLPDSFVPCSTSLPMTVAARPGIEDGTVGTLDQYAALFHKNALRIDSMEDLAYYVADLDDNGHYRPAQQNYDILHFYSGYIVPEFLTDIEAENGFTYGDYSFCTMDDFGNSIPIDPFNFFIDDFVPYLIHVDGELVHHYQVPH